jgi:hypothetical protein
MSSGIIVSSRIWPVCSSDLTLEIFIFCGCSKDKIYNSNPRMEDLKENICREIANIAAASRENLNIFRRCEESIRVEGQHFQHL